MRGIIVAGGLGTRMRPLTDRRPKPLFPLVNHPFLEYQVALLKQHGIDEIAFATNYMADRIEAHFADGSAFGVRMRYALEEVPLGTGGAIRNAAELFPRERVIVLNGDILTDFDLRGLMDFHVANAAVATIALHPVPRPNAYGVVTLDGRGRLASWNEPSEAAKREAASGVRPGATGTDLINAGIYILEPEFLAEIPAGVRSSIERDIYPRLIAAGESVFGAAPAGFWLDVGRPEQMLEASIALLMGAVSAPLPLARIAADAHLSPTARVDRLTTIGRGSKVGAGSLLERCIVLNDVEVGENVRLADVIVDDGARVESGTTVVAKGGVEVIAGA